MAERSAGDILLNFVPTRPKNFSVITYCRPRSADESKEDFEVQVSSSWLPPKESPDARRKDFQSYWTSSTSTPGFEKRIVDCRTDFNLTNRLLITALLEAARSQLNEIKCEFDPESYRRQIDFIVEEYEEGERIVWAQPHYLREPDTFGILVGLHFRTKSEHRGTRMAMVRSLALTPDGSANLEYYLQEYNLISSFVSTHLEKLFPLRVSETQISLSKELLKLPSQSLNQKTYRFANERTAASQFTGVKSYGPRQPIRGRGKVLFFFREQDRRLSRDLYRALRGDTFRTFPGMKRMFGFEISKETVQGFSLDDGYRATSIETALSQAETVASQCPVVGIFLTPFSRFDSKEENEQYWHLKHAALEQRIPVQVVATETIRNPQKLKWSTSNIGLGIFAKLGGVPWVVRPTTERCLIIGLGQAHSLGRNREILRHFAYSVITDSSGEFEEVRVLSQSRDEEQYLTELGQSLLELIRDHEGSYSQFVVHTTFAIRREEIERVEAILEQVEDSESSSGRRVVLIKFGNRSKYFGFSAQHNSRVPYESTFVQLSRSTFLVWFEGLQYGKTRLVTKTARPTEVRFLYPRSRLSYSDKLRFLQDAVNLSGANWRGFNAKSAPVSTFYARLIARYYREFQALGLPRVDLNMVAPWFL